MTLNFPFLLVKQIVKYYLNNRASVNDNVVLHF